MPKLTKKQRGFVKDYLETGNGSLAVKKNYDVSTDLTARTIASENLTKPNIQKAIEEALPDDLLAKKHLQFLNSDREEIGIKGLDMAYKLKGSYAPEKTINANMNVSIDIEEKAKEAISRFLEKK